MLVVFWDAIDFEVMVVAEFEGPVSDVYENL